MSRSTAAPPFTGQRMDDLDRMFRRLVQNIRNGFPEYLTRPFEVAEIYQSIIPYRHNRRELAIETNQDYEVALCQLLAGARGYLEGEEIMQETIRRELAGANVNTSIYREFAATRVTLSPSAMRKYEQMAIGEHTTAPTPVAPPAPPAAERRPAPQVERAAMATTAELEAPRAPARSSGGITNGPCRYCGGALPEGRRTVYCPHCGQNLTVQRCPACGTELDSAWKFCITCGRGVAQA